MLKRMRNDYQLAIISLFSVCAVVGVFPFAVYRLLTGNYLLAALDGAIVAGISSVFAFAWRTGRTCGPGWVMAAINNTGAVLSALMLGDSGLLWIYAVLLANFFLVPRPLALVLTVLEVGGLALHGAIFDSALHASSFVVSSLLVSTLALILAHWTDFQRRQLELLATHDPLTGLRNRRAMQEDIERAILVSQRTRTPCGLALVDIDHFKAVNDRHGHAAGDAVLVTFAGLLRNSVRKVDSVYRYGGEEFLLLLPGAGLKGLAKITESLRASVAAELKGPEGPLTASLGAAVHWEGESADSWLLRADAALYRAKDQGRNRVCLDEDGFDEEINLATQDDKGSHRMGLTNEV